MIVEDQNPDLAWKHYHRNRSFFLFWAVRNEPCSAFSFSFSLGFFLWWGWLLETKREFWLGVLNFSLLSRADGNQQGIRMNEEKCQCVWRRKKFPLSYRIMLLLALSLVICFLLLPLHTNRHTDRKTHSHGWIDERGEREGVWDWEEWGLTSDRKNNATDSGERREWGEIVLIDGKDRTWLSCCSCLLLWHVLVLTDPKITQRNHFNTDQTKPTN